MTQTPEKFRSASRYELLRQVGHGPLTRVFLCAQRTRGQSRLAMLELLHKELASIEDFRALFLDQAAGTLALRHPHLVRTGEVIANPEACGVSLELLPGQSLGRVLTRLGRSRFPVDVHLCILRQVLTALEHAHHFTGPGGPRDGFVHGNVCPNNVLITYDGEVKLLGVGFAGAYQALEQRLGRRLADVRYAAPELLLGASAEPSTDLFGVGVMLWEALTQRARSASDDTQTLIRKRTRGEEPALQSAWPDAPDTLVELCRRALSVDPGERYTDAGELREALDAYLARAFEPIDAVLARLPDLMRSAFVEEREEMRLFIDASLESLGASTPPESEWEADADATPHDAEWNAETSTALPPDAGQALAETLAEALEAPRRGPSSVPPRPSVPPYHDTYRDVPLASPPRDTDTGGHRAFSATLPSTPLVAAGRARLGRQLLPIGAMALVGAMAAGVLHYAFGGVKRAPRPASVGQKEVSALVPPPAPRLAPQQRPPEPARAAAPPPPLPAAPPAPTPPPAPQPEPESEPEPAEPLAAAPVALGAETEAAPDAGVEAAAAPPAVPAFFDGRASDEGTAEPPALSLDDLPAFDEARDSLQDAILSGARARQLALKRKRGKKAEPLAPAPEDPSESALPRSIDESDPYTGQTRP